MNNLTIAIDMDNVINNLMERALCMYSQNSTSQLSMDDITHYSIYKILGVTEGQKFCNLFLKKELWDSLSPLPKAQWGIKKLIDSGHRVVFATATDPINFPWKTEWVEHFFPFVGKNNIICIQNKGLLHVDVLIDDCIDNLLSSVRFERICLDYPWNRDVHDEVYSIYRAFDWEDIVHIVDQIYKDFKEGTE